MIEQINELRTKISKLEAEKIKAQTLEEELKKKITEIEEEIKAFNVSPAEAKEYIEKEKKMLLTEIEKISKKLEEPIC